MAYCFEPWRYDGTYETRINPFTKQSREVPRNAPLTAAESAAVVHVLRRVAPGGPDAHGLWNIRTEDGGIVEIVARALDTMGCTVFIRRTTHDVMALLYELLTTVDWVFMSESGAAATVIVSSPRAVRGAPPGAVGVVTCTSAAQLAEMLGENGLDDWRDC
jgi:hypothetical protein